MRDASRPFACALPMAIMLIAALFYPPLPSPALPPTFTELRPDGGEVIPGGTSYGIFWNATHDPPMDLRTTLRYSIDGPGSYPLFITSDFFPEGGATYPWPVPLWNTTGAGVRVCARASDGMESCRESAANFTITATPPYFDILSPSNGARNVPLDAEIAIGFDPPPSPMEVLLSISPAMTFTPAWSADGKLLWIRRPGLLPPCTTFSVSVTVGGVTRSSTFSTYCSGARILSITPPRLPTDPIVVEFATEMVPASVTWVIAPLVTLRPSWSPDHRTLSLYAEPAWATCTLYSFTITGGMDVWGDALQGSGPVPNPISFLLGCLEPPHALVVSESPPDVLLTWLPVVGATGYHVYESGDRFATFPTGWNLIGAPTATSFLASGHDADGQTHFYVVRATDSFSESANSTMGVKTVLGFPHSPSQTNIAWFSLAYRTAYRKASDIATALGSSRIDVVGKWDPATQMSTAYYYARGGWWGRDFPIAAGDGLYVGTRAAFAWTLVGTDADRTLLLTRNDPPRANVNWVGLPSTGVYSKASDVSGELGSGKITEVALWNAATQTATRWAWNGTAWTGTDFTFAPGAGVYLIVASSFAWRPTLVTPEMP